MNPQISQIAQKEHRRPERLALPGSGAVLGGDVGWAEKRRHSAACYLTFDREGATFQTVRFTANPTDLTQSLFRLVDHRPLLAAAFDGPFRRDLDEIGVYRTCEAVLTKGLAPHIGKPGQSSSGNGRKLNAAANAFVKATLAIMREEPNGKAVCCIANAHHLAAIHPSAVVEAFPTSFLGLMLDDGGREPGEARSDTYFKRLTQPEGGRLAGLVKSLLGGRSLLLGRRCPPDEGAERPIQDFHDHDERAAIVCAVTGVVCSGTPINGHRRRRWLHDPAATGCDRRVWIAASVDADNPHQCRRDTRRMPDRRSMTGAHAEFTRVGSADSRLSESLRPVLTKNSRVRKTTSSA